MPRMTKKDWGPDGPPGRQDRASDKQLAFIERLTKWAGVGTLASHGIKHVLEYNPGDGRLSKRQAEQVITALKKLSEGWRERRP